MLAIHRVFPALTDNNGATPANLLSCRPRGLEPAVHVAVVLLPSLVLVVGWGQTA